MAFALDQAELVGASIESMLYGIYVMIFPVSVYILITRHQERRGMAFTNKFLLIGAVLLFCFITASWILDQLRLWAAFITHQDRFGGPTGFYAHLSDKRNVLRIVVFVLEVATLDCLLLYRLFIVWNCDWRVVVLPSLTFAGTMVFGVMDCIGYAHAWLETGLWLPVNKYILAGFTCNLLTNILAVVFISGRILAQDRESRSLSNYRNSLSWIILSLVESAGIYCVFNFTVMIAVALQKPFAFTIFTAASPITGISFCLITLRVGLSDWISRVAMPSHASNPVRQSTTIPMVLHVRHHRCNPACESSTSSMKDQPLQDTMPTLSCV